MSFPSWLSRLAALTLAVVLAAGLARLALVPLLWREDRELKEGRAGGR